MTPPEKEEQGETCSPIHEAFVNHPPKDPAVTLEIEWLKEDASKFMRKLDELEKRSPSTTRYVKLAKTELESSVMWAMKALMLGDVNK